jgi:large subunit ribosomal protein L18e
MGIDLKNHHSKVKGRTAPKSEDVYLRLLVKLYTFLARRTNSEFNKVVLKRLITTRMQRSQVSLSNIARRMSSEDENKIVCVVSTITDDERLLTVPKLTVCALRVTESARARILKAGGNIMTFDELAIQRPTGSNTVLLRGKTSTRLTTKYWGAPGVPNSSARPYIRSKGRKFEKARGRRNSRGFKN